jgi:hypothetical protein
MIRQAIAGMALMTAANGYAANDQAVVGERDFAAAMRERLRVAAPDLETRESASDPLVIEIKHEGEWGRARINLHRLHAFCGDAAAEDCEAVLANFVRRTTAPLPEPTSADLRVVVRNRFYVEHLLETQPEDARPIYRQIGDDLFALLAFDFPDGVGIAVPEQLRSLGLEDTGAWRVAGDQTRAVLPELPLDVDLAKYPVSFQEYDFLPSLLADVDAWPPLAEKAGPDLFAAAISDFSVWIGVMPDGPRFEDFKRAVRAECAEWERCISPNVYRFRDGRWVIAD